MIVVDNRRFFVCPGPGNRPFRALWEARFAWICCLVLVSAVVGLSRSCGLQYRRLELGQRRDQELGHFEECLLGLAQLAFIFVHGLPVLGYT